MATTFKLDIDKRFPFDFFLLQRAVNRIIKVGDLLGLDLFLPFKTKETKNGYHIYIECYNKLTDIETCLIQTLMGSDYKRECFNFIRIKHHKNNWNVLFNKKFRYNLKTKELKKISEEK